MMIDQNIEIITDAPKFGTDHMGTLDGVMNPPMNAPKAQHQIDWVAR